MGGGWWFCDTNRERKMQVPYPSQVRTATTTEEHFLFTLERAVKTIRPPSVPRWRGPRLRLRLHSRFRLRHGVRHQTTLLVDDTNRFISAVKPRLMPVSCALGGLPGRGTPFHTYELGSRKGTT